MNKIPELIHVHIYEPHNSIFKSSKNNKSEIHKYYCEDSQNCPELKQGRCVNVCNLFSGLCPKGTKQCSTGYTTRASKYRSQIKGWKEIYKNTYNKLKSSPRRITKVSGGWILPYVYMGDNKEVPFNTHSGFFITGYPYLKDEDFNVVNVRSIVHYIAVNISGHTIREYQEKSVPKFVRDLYNLYPDKFEEFSEEIPELGEILKCTSLVGRKAILKTLTPNVEVLIKKKVWWWDGEKISIKDANFMIFEPVGWESCYASFTPNDEASVEITSEEQVNENTILAD